MPFLLSNRDAGFLGKLQSSFHNEMFKPTDIYFPKSLVQPKFIAVYRESDDSSLENFLVITIPCHILLDPPESEWKKEGIVEMRSLKASFSREVLLRGRGGIPFPMPENGCMVAMEGVFYLLTEIRPKGYFGNTEHWMMLVCWGIRKQLPSTNTNQTLITDDLPPIEINWPNTVR